MPDWIENKYKGKLGYIPYMPLDGTQVWSMEKVFSSSPPYNTKLFDKLCVRTKLFGKCLEGDNFCSFCGTITPSVPNSHHPTCCNYNKGESYPEDTDSWWLGSCPYCKITDYITLSIDSNIDAGVSEISCSECGYTFQDNCCEEELVEKFIRGELIHDRQV